MIEKSNRKNPPYKLYRLFAATLITVVVLAVSSPVSAYDWCASIDPSAGRNVVDRSSCVSITFNQNRRVIRNNCNVHIRYAVCYDDFAEHYTCSISGDTPMLTYKMTPGQFLYHRDASRPLKWWAWSCE